MKSLKTLLKIVAVLLPTYAVSYAFNYFVFDDATLFSISNVFLWIYLAAFTSYMFIWGDLSEKKRAEKRKTE